MEVTGRIKVLGAEQKVTETFKKRELVISTEEQYPQLLMIEFVQDKCDLLNNYMIGDNVKVSINLRGREWVSPQGETKYFNSIHGWKIEKIVDGAPSQPMPQATPDSAFTPAPTLNQDEPDDLPF